MAKILVTGGPVGAKLDAVKWVTNGFRGGRMAALADALRLESHDVFYLMQKGSREPEHCSVITHEGFADYMGKVRSIVRDVDMIVMGAAVANLIPEPPWGTEQKFPSHEFEEGETVEVPFKVSPRIINMVKEINPRVKLIGFKLLAGVGYDELLMAANKVMDGSNADIVVANELSNLDQKYVLTKERGIISMKESFLANFLSELAKDKYYHTSKIGEMWKASSPTTEDIKMYRRLVRKYANKIIEHGKQPNGMIFGCVATRIENRESGFLCSQRGKSLTFTEDDPVHVITVLHDDDGGDVSLPNDEHRKASLNAPLLSEIFRTNPDVMGIVHIHDGDEGNATYDYAPPGTVRDSRRECHHDFHIKGHGSFYLMWESDMPPEFEKISFGLDSRLFDKLQKKCEWENKATDLALNEAVQDYVNKLEQ